MFEKDKTVNEIEIYDRRETETSALVPIEFSQATATYKGAQVDLLQFVAAWVEEVAHENLSHFASGSLSDGTYERTAEAERTFEPKELTVNDIDVAVAKLRTTFPVRVVRPAIMSHFEVATRGRTLSFAPIEIGGSLFRMDLTFYKATID